eukprot:6686498-Alexandrium_andersonii.AAC.1
MTPPDYHTDMALRTMLQRAAARQSVLDAARLDGHRGRLSRGRASSQPPRPDPLLSATLPPLAPASSHTAGFPVPGAPTGP